MSFHPHDCSASGHIMTGDSEGLHLAQHCAEVTGSFHSPELHWAWYRNGSHIKPLWATLS